MAVVGRAVAGRNIQGSQAIDTQRLMRNSRRGGNMARWVGSGRWDVCMVFFFGLA